MKPSSKLNFRKEDFLRKYRRSKSSNKQSATSEGYASNDEGNF
jgi:hypothetical protein